MLNHDTQPADSAILTQSLRIVGTRRFAIFLEFGPLVIPRGHFRDGLPLPRLASGDAGGRISSAFMPASSAFASSISASAGAILPIALGAA